MTEQELIDKAIEIIKKHTRTEALGAFDCALRGYYPLDYDKCINEVAELIDEDNEL